MRPFRRRDAAAIHEAVIASLEELQQWLPWASPDYSKIVSQQFVRDSIGAWNSGRAYDFTVRRINNPQRHIGNVSVWHLSRQNSVGEIGYWVRSDEARQGICTEAAAHILQIGFEELGLHRITLRTAAGNRASERVAEKLGFLREGLLRNEVKIGNHWVDHAIWGLLVEEWKTKRESDRIHSP